MSKYTYPTNRKEGFYNRYLKPGKASNFIRHARDEIKSGDLVVLCCRVSHWTQNHRGNLNDSEKHLRQRAEELGAVVVDVCRHVGSGWDPLWLAEAVAVAQQRGAKLFAESTDRLIRNPMYSKNLQDLQAREEDLLELKGWTDGSTLVTDLHPDAKPSEVRSYQRRRGQKMKGKRGGRPRKNISEQLFVLTDQATADNTMPPPAVIDARELKEYRSTIWALFKRLPPN